MSINENIYHALVTAAVADAMAMPLMSRPTHLIKQDYGNGNYVFDILPSLDDAPGVGQPIATVTDVFFPAYLMFNQFSKDKKVTVQGVKAALIEWHNHNRHFQAFADFSDKAAVQKILGDYIPDRFDAVPCEARHRGASGAARAFIAGLVNPNNQNKAIRDAITITMCTHPNAIVTSGAAAVAAATAAAFSTTATVADIVDSGFKAVQKGYLLGEHYSGYTAVGSKIERRMELAVNIGIQYGGDFDQCIKEMSEVIGTGNLSSESVPSAFGFFVAANGNPETAVRMALNAGKCCNYTATIAGVLSAVFSKQADVLAPFVEKVERSNQFALADVIS